MENGVRCTGTKTLLARQMTRGEYNAYRGWAAPKGEDQSTAGYLVEYEDGGSPNDSRHAGYISWSPADVFERSYRPIGSFQDRVRHEKAELDEKLAKLQAFFATNVFAGLPIEGQELLQQQAAHMDDYSVVLGQRIDAF